MFADYKGTLEVVHIAELSEVLKYGYAAERETEITRQS